MTELEKAPILKEILADGAIWKLTLNTPKANIIDEPMVECLTGIFTEAGESADVKALVITGSGRHFSFGASVQEHLPATVQGMLERFHNMFRVLSSTGIFTIAAVSGQCLGGGLELASFCHKLICSPDASLGQPEIVLGVFPPVASVILRDRMSRAAVEDLCISGRSVKADEALRLGLVDQIADDPVEQSLDYIESHLLPKSASSLRYASRAVRLEFNERLHKELDKAEALYLEKLMSTRDAVEGLEAFLQKRKPVWSNQ